MQRFLTLYLLLVFLAACTPMGTSTPLPTAEVKPVMTFTAVPTFTPTASPTSTPSSSLGTIALDFIALLCNAAWMNGVQHITTCPDFTADHSGGYAAALDPAVEGLTADVPILLTIPTANALFLRYPSFSVGTNDRFRTTLLCQVSYPCNVQFALEYYDAKGKYHGSFLSWDYNTGDAPINVDEDLSLLAGQSVNFVLAIRLLHTIDNPQQDNGIWIAPHIYRPLQ